MASNISLNYNGENMLNGANRLNIRIKEYMDNKNLTPDNISNLDEDIKNDLIEFKLDIVDYMPDMEQYTFAPRNDRLTKEGVLEDLRINLDRINKVLAAAADTNITGGKRKSRKNKKSKRIYKKSKRTYRKKSYKRRTNKR
jgi:hypothetical protein